eukprot:g4026.t1
MANLKRILLLVRDVPRAVEFYHRGLGLPIVHSSSNWAELSTGNGSTPLCLTAANNEAAATTGYSPLLSFNVDDLDNILTNCLGLGGTMDGAIKFRENGRAVAIRTPEGGQMISLFEAIK